MVRDMTDTFASTGEATPVGVDPVTGDPWVISPTGRQCKAEEFGERCLNMLPDGSPPARKYCDVHYVGNGGKVKRARAEKAPKLVVEMGGKAAGKKDQRVADTAAGATAFMNVVAAGLAATGDNTCAAAVAGGSAQWGQAVGELSKFQPWLAQFFAPVGGDSQLGAWLSFLMATGAIALPVLAHHNMLPSSVGAKMGGVFVAATEQAPDGVSSPAA
jgi:hypothetical protein